MGDPLHEWLNLDAGSSVFQNGFQDVAQVNSQGGNAMFQYQAIPQQTKLQGQHPQASQRTPLQTSHQSLPKTVSHFPRYQPPQTMRNPSFAVPSLPTTNDASSISQRQESPTAPLSSGGNLGLSNLEPQDIMNWINMAEYNAGGMSLGPEHVQPLDMAGTAQPSFAPDVSFSNLVWPQAVSSTKGIPNGTDYHAQHQYLPQPARRADTASARTLDHSTMLPPQAPLQPPFRGHNPAEECMRMQYWIQNGFPEVPLDQSNTSHPLPAQTPAPALGFVPNVNGTQTAHLAQQVNPAVQGFPAYEESSGLGNAYPKETQYPSNPKPALQSTPIQQSMPSVPQNPSQSECEQFLAYAMAMPLDTMATGQAGRSEVYHQHTAVAGQLGTLSLCPEDVNPASELIL